MYSGYRRPTAEVLRLVVEGELGPTVPHGTLLAALVQLCAERDPWARPSFKRVCEELSSEDLAVAQQVERGADPL